METVQSLLVLNEITQYLTYFNHRSIIFGFRGLLFTNNFIVDVCEFIDAGHLGINS